MERKKLELDGSTWWVPALVAGTVFFVLAALLGVLMFWERPGTPGSGATMAQEGEAAPALETYPLDTRPVLVLDAGHGGIDGGAVDATGTVAEAIVNQQMVERVMERLAAHEGELKVVQAHEPGSFAQPMVRANTAVANNADLFVSLHLNADTSPYTSGFQVYPAPPGRVHHEESIRFAQGLVQQVENAGVSVLGTNGIYYCYYRKVPGGYVKELVDSTTVDADNPPAHESFGVVEYAGCPAALVEMWHISSYSDMATYHTDEGMDLMANCVYLAICEYFGLTPIEK